MESTSLFPLSGKVLALLVEAFDLRQWDCASALSGRTATRFFSAERISPREEDAIWLALAHALIASDLVPRSLAETALQPPIMSEKDTALSVDVRLAKVLRVYGGCWDTMVGALRRNAPPVWSPRLLHLVFFQLLAVDFAVRRTGMQWLMRADPDAPVAIPWVADRGIGEWLREHLATATLTRDETATLVKVHRHTVDGWLDTDARPRDENLQDLADALAARGLDSRERLLRQLRLVYGLRALFVAACDAIEPEHVANLVVRVIGYARHMIELPRIGKNPGENDLKMRLAVVVGSLGRERFSLPFVESMLNSVWRLEPDPVWRTTIKAATRSWFELLRSAATKLPVESADELTRVLGEKPSPELLEQIAYVSLAAKEEQARDPLMRAAMASETAAGGVFGGLELKLQGIEAANRGDLLRSIDLLRDAARLDPGNAEIHFRLGGALWQIGDVDAGLLELEIAVQLDLGWDRAHTEIAIVLINLGRVAEAQQRLTAALPLLREPSSWLLLHLAFAHERLGDRARAAEVYEELIALDPEHGEALDRLAHLRFVQGDKRAGADLAKRAAHRGVIDALVAWRTGYYNTGKPTERPPRRTPRHLVQLCDRPERT